MDCLSSATWVATIQSESKVRQPCSLSDRNCSRHGFLTFCLSAYQARKIWKAKYGHQFDVPDSEANSQAGSRAPSQAGSRASSRWGLAPAHTQYHKRTLRRSRRAKMMSLWRFHMHPSQRTNRGPSTASDPSWLLSLAGLRPRPVPDPPQACPRCQLARRRRSASI